MDHTAARVTVSIVSHGHDAQLPGLLDELASGAQGCIAQVIVTHNLPPEGGLAASARPWRLVERISPQPAGFAVNHNRAFDGCDTPFFAVLNPDVRGFSADFWPRLLEAAQHTGVGCVYPRLLNADGSVQDNVRDCVTPWSLLRRYLLHSAETRAEWVSAACWLVPSAVWRELGGLDPRYRMYCEDTDWCLRLRLSGYALEPAVATAVHAAARSSRLPGRAMAWHLASLLRLWTRPHWWQFVTMRRTP